MCQKRCTPCLSAELKDFSRAEAQRINVIKELSMPNNYQNIKALLMGPKFPDKEFIRSGTTFGEVYAMAAGLRAALSGPEYQGASICLTIDDRAVMAAVLLTEKRDTPLVSKQKARLEIEKMILGTRPVEVNHRDPKKLMACLGGKA